MKYIILLLLLVLGLQTSVWTQDLLIADNGDSIPCKIFQIDNDSAVHYKAGKRYDLYGGYLKKDYYSEIVLDYYDNLRRNDNPNNSLGFYSFGIYYTSLDINPIIEVFLENETLLKRLGNGTTFSLSYQKFIDPYVILNQGERSFSNICLGVNYEYFIRSAESENQGYDLRHRVHSFSFLFTYHTKYKYTTYITLKPGLMFNKYDGFYANDPLKSNSTMFRMKLEIHQKIINLNENFSLFFAANPFITMVKSGRIAYKELNYNSSINYTAVQYDFGFSTGLSLKYFY